MGLERIVFSSAAHIVLDRDATKTLITPLSPRPELFASLLCEFCRLRPGGIATPGFHRGYDRSRSPNLRATEIVFRPPPPECHLAVTKRDRRPSAESPPAR